MHYFQENTQVQSKAPSRSGKGKLTSNCHKLENIFKRLLLNKGFVFPVVRNMLRPGEGHHKILESAYLERTSRCCIQPPLPCPSSPKIQSMYYSMHTSVCTCQVSCLRGRQVLELHYLIIPIIYAIKNKSLLIQQTNSNHVHVT